SRASVSSLLSPTLGDYQRSRDEVGAAIGQFDIAMTAASDTSGPSSSFLTAMNGYNLNTSRLNGAIDTTNGNLSQAAGAVDSAQTSLNSKPYDLTNSQASVDNAASAVQTAQTNLDNAVVTAPSAGVVASIASQVGETAANPFMVLANTTSLVLHGTIGESDVAKVKMGLVANVAVDAVTTAGRMTGRVTSLDPVA